MSNKHNNNSDNILTSRRTDGDKNPILFMYQFRLCSIEQKELFENNMHALERLIQLVAIS